MLKSSSRILALLATIAAACGGRAESLDAQYGEARVRNRVSTAREATTFEDVRTTLNQRCVVCHGCYDAPCQLKLSAFEGIARGGSTDKVYDATRLVAADPTRLFEDASGTVEWRQKGFHPVLNERAQSRKANLEGSLLMQMLELKRKHPLPKQKRLQGFDFGIDREQSCPTIESFPTYEKDHALGGMPYGLPAIEEAAFERLKTWIAQGAPRRPAHRLPHAYRVRVNEWEAWLNEDSPRQRLVSRYLFEHLFLFNLHFKPNDTRFFEMVRSTTPPGTAVDRIATRRPFDDPGAKRVYYRIVPRKTTTLRKTHIPYLLDAARMQRWQSLFLEPTYEVKKLPSYDQDKASNPFITFRDLPLSSRYRFLLDDAHQMVMSFIKGPVCRGNSAVNVIEERFWIFFLDPKRFATPDLARFFDAESSLLSLPASDGSTAGLLVNWAKYARYQRRYLRDKSRYAAKKVAREHTNMLGYVWDGEGHNPNAALTVFRHYDNADVVKGLVGDPPKTAWVLGYGTLERIHYLLVSGFDVFGNLGHQVNTRIYMEFLRMEAEAHFLSLLPPKVRRSELNRWYRGVSKSTKDYVLGDHFSFRGKNDIAFKTKNPKRELFQMLKTRLRPVLSERYSLATTDGVARESGGNKPAVLSEVARKLAKLTQARGKHIAAMPELMVLSVEDAGGAHALFSMSHERGYKNVSSLLDDKGQRIPKENRLSVARGIVGSYPNAFLRVRVAEVDAFVAAVRAMKTKADYLRLLDAYGVRRTNPSFWEHSDEVHRALRQLSELEYGLLDYNRLENR